MAWRITVLLCWRTCIVLAAFNASLPILLFKCYLQSESYHGGRILSRGGQQKWLPCGEPFLCVLCSFYLATFWSKFAMMLAAWARMVLPLGSMVPFSWPLIRSLPLAQLRAVSAQKLMEPSSGNWVRSPIAVSRTP